MQVKVDDKQRSFFVVANATDALECLAIIESRVQTEEWNSHHLVAAANGLDRWLQKRIAAEAQ